MTNKEMWLIAKTLGIDMHVAVWSNKLKDKTLPLNFNRNKTTEGSDNHALLENLVMCGIMETDNNTYFWVSDKGLELFRKQWVEQVIYLRKDDWDVAYIKYKIDFYCDYYKYTFGSNEVFETYKNVPNITKSNFYKLGLVAGVVLDFKKELDYIFKKTEPKKKDSIEVFDGYVLVDLTLAKYLENANHVLYSPTLDLFGFTENNNEVKTMLTENMELRFGFYIEEKTLETDLVSLGWKKDSTNENKFMFCGTDFNDRVKEVTETYNLVRFKKKIIL